MDKEKKREGDLYMSELHELPCTEMVKSGTIIDSPYAAVCDT